MARKATPAPDWMAKKGVAKLDPVEATRAAAQKASPSGAKQANVRTKQFSTNVTPEFFSRFKIKAAQEGMKLYELLEASLDSYERERR